jgi:hypothetical protein
MDDVQSHIAKRVDCRAQSKLAVLEVPLHLSCIIDGQSLYRQNFVKLVFRARYFNAIGPSAKGSDQMIPRICAVDGFLYSLISQFEFILERDLNRRDPLIAYLVMWLVWCLPKNIMSLSSLRVVW